MRIAFYAPMKPPDHPLPSGDRQVGRLLMEALSLAGHDVALTSRFRSWEGKGDEAAQVDLKKQGLCAAERLIASDQAAPATARPELWFTYHLYYKAPDWIGPRVAKALSIPYIVAEASVAYKRAGGPWDLGHRNVLEALVQASAVITLNPADADCLPDPGKLRFLKPFLDPKPYGKAHGERAQHRQGLARRLDLNPSRPWLLTVAMMREGDKFQSYRILSEALCRMRDQDWTLVIVGDGPAAPEVRNLFSAIPATRLRFLGALPSEDLFEVYAACDLLAWPAVREAYGMALLEAQATGLPVLAGESPGVAAVLGDGESAVLVEEGSTEAFSTALEDLLADPGRLPQLSAGALRRVRQHHSLKSASRRLDDIVREAAAR